MSRCGSRMPACRARFRCTAGAARARPAAAAGRRRAGRARRRRAELRTLAATLRDRYPASSGGRCVSTASRPPSSASPRPEFDFPRGAELWLPLAPGLTRSAAEWRTDPFEYVGILLLVARCAPGVTLAQAAESADRRRPRARCLAPGAAHRPAHRARAFQTHVVGPARPGDDRAVRRRRRAACSWPAPMCPASC